MPGRNISILLNLIYFENLFRDIGFSSSYCFVPVYLSSVNTMAEITLRKPRTPFVKILLFHLKVPKNPFVSDKYRTLFARVNRPR